jgi:DNA-binding transcriptional MocR family regulator
MISPYKFTPQARLLDFMRQAGKPNLINLAAGLPSVDCVPKADLRRAFDAAFDEEPDVALGYHTPDGDYLLREQIAARLNSRGIKTTADELVTTTGCTQALHGMIRLRANPDDIVACEAPAYYATLEILGDTGLRVLPIPVKDEHGIDIEHAASLFELYRPKLLVLCSTLSNPSGATIPNETRKTLLEICRKTGTHILEDEIYGELTEIAGLRPIRSFDDGTTVSYVSSFSKTVSPGIRVGFCLAKDDREKFALLKCQQDMHSATVCEVAFRKYLERCDLDRHLAFLKNFNRARRKLATEVIRKTFPPSTKIWNAAGGFMLWVEARSSTEIEQVYDACLRQNVVFSRGDAFFTSAESKIKAMRINCSRATEQNLVDGLEILGTIISKS